METLVIYSSDRDFTQRLYAALPKDITRRTSIHLVEPHLSILDTLKYEIPDVVLLGIGSNEDWFETFQKVDEDPWLEDTIFILVSPEADEELFDHYRGFNIAYILDESRLEAQLPQVVETLEKTKDLLNHSGLIQKITNLSGELVLDNNLMSVYYYASLFSNYLYREGYLSRSKRLALHLSLTELLVNAIEHGNAGITFEEKSEWLSKHRTIQALVEERLKRPENLGKLVRLQYSIGPMQSEFIITDDGDGFDTSIVKKLGKDVSLVHGRGILLSRKSVDKLEYNEKGNQVRLTIIHDGTAERQIPYGFVSQSPKEFQSGQVIFSENEPGDNLYYIVSGEYAVYVQGKRITELSTRDIFMGEMGFLLGNRRSATVICTKPGKLVEISREVFADAIRRYPNYGIFLLKTLAKRLREANLRYAGNADFSTSFR
jgi:anti-sigma regulatory factor (Ser/Thr protein kinase)